MQLLNKLRLLHEPLQSRKNWSGCWFNYWPFSGITSAHSSLTNYCMHTSSHTHSPPTHIVVIDLSLLHGLRWVPGAHSYHPLSSKQLPDRGGETSQGQYWDIAEDSVAAIFPSPATVAADNTEMTRGRGFGVGCNGLQIQDSVHTIFHSIISRAGWGRTKCSHIAELNLLRDYYPSWVK